MRLILTQPLERFSLCQLRIHPFCSLWCRRRSCLFDVVSKGSARGAEFMLNLSGAWFLFGDGRCAALGWERFSEIDALVRLASCWLCYSTDYMRGIIPLCKVTDVVKSKRTWLYLPFYLTHESNSICGQLSSVYPAYLPKSLWNYRDPRATQAASARRHAWS